MASSDEDAQRSSTAGRDGDEEEASHANVAQLLATDDVAENEISLQELVR